MNLWKDDIELEVEMKKVFIIFIITILLLSLNKFGYSQLTGRDIMIKVDEQQDVKSQYAKTKMTLINKRGKTRIRDVLRYEKSYYGEKGIDTKTLIFFEYPPDIRGTGLLLWSYEDIKKDDDRWLYLPALKKIKRIAGESKNNYFMGTDFTYDDMGGREVDEDTHELLGQDEIDGINCYKVQSIPVDKNDMYSKKFGWVIPEKWVVFKVDFYDKRGKLIKELRASDFREVSNIWTTFKLHMNNFGKNHQTVIEVEDMKYNIEIKDQVFMKTTLQRGRVK